MHARARGVLALFVLAVGLGLAGCDSIERLQDSVTDMFDRKKKLPGERERVFPEGVPGVVQGVPPEYLPENKPQESDPTALAKPPEPEKPVAEKPPAERPAAEKPVRRQRTAKPAETAEPDAAEAPKEVPAAKPARPTRQTTAQQPRKSTVPAAQPVSPAPSAAPSAPAAPAPSSPQPFPAPARNTPLPWPTAPSQ